MTEEPIHETVEQQISDADPRGESRDTPENLDIATQEEADEALDQEQAASEASQRQRNASGVEAESDEAGKAVVEAAEKSADAGSPSTDRDEDEDEDQAEAESEWDGVLRIGEVEATLESVVEAILFASDEPLTAGRMVSIIEAGSAKQIRQCVQSLNARYEESNASFRIEKIAGGYQMMTLPAYNHWLKKMVRVRSDSKLTGAALETLAIVAYKQPIIRADVEAIRGVACGEVLRNLMYKGMVKMVGRAEVLGRPVLYGTTKKFLDAFGLHSLKDLPKIEELKRPDA